MKTVVLVLAVINIVVALFALASGEQGGWLPALCGWGIVVLDHAT